MQLSILNSFPKALEFSRISGIPLSQTLDESTHTIIMEEGILKIHSPGKNWKDFSLDFDSGKIRHMLHTPSPKNQAFRKALGAIRARPRVFEGCLGLGKDALLMASWGLQVESCERAWPIRLLFENALERMNPEGAAAQIFKERIRIHWKDSFKVLQSLHEKPDCVYLDPMYPERVIKALPSKELRLLKEILSEEDNSLEVFELAMEKTHQRVVVKRPLKAKKLVPHPEPSLIVKGKSTRYDVYLVSRPSPPEET